MNYSKTQLILSGHYCDFFMGGTWGGDGNLWGGARATQWLRRCLATVVIVAVVANSDTSIY